MKKVAILFVVLLTSSFLFAQKTYVPDDKFEQALIDLGYDTTLDDSVLTANISGVTVLDVSRKSISDLTGIEAFTSLIDLSCAVNQLTSLDVSNNTALEVLNLDDNQLTSLDLSKNTALTYLTCWDNELTSLDVSNNTALYWLAPVGNQLTSLDVSKNTALIELNVHGNQLTGLDVSANTVLSHLNCNHNQLTSLDVSKNTALDELQVQDNQLTSLDVSKNTVLETLMCGGNQLTALDVSNNTALTTLDCRDNKLTSLDVSNNTALTYLHCAGNQLTSLDISKNTDLLDLNCGGNQLTSLDVTSNIALTHLSCWANKLTTLDLSKNIALTHLQIQSWDSEHNQLTSLDVSANTALTFLALGRNQLTNLDVTKNIELKHLWCSYNSLTSLDLSKNTALNFLDCNDNQLSTLDLSTNSSLKYIECQNNQLTYLNMRNGVTDGLTTFDATDNSLTCIETLDPVYATTNWTSANGKIDAGVTFGFICGGTDLTTWHVATTGSDGSGSGTETSPLASIQTAINATTDGDTVLVAAGTYNENIDIDNKQIVLGSHLLTNGDRSYITSTIISGVNDDTVLDLRSSCEVIGFTIQDGKGFRDAGETETRGGGLICKNASSPKIRDMIFQNNSATTGGGAFRIEGGSHLTAEKILIRSNYAQGFGGAINAWDGSITADNLLIYANESDGSLFDFGGGGTATLKNSTIVDNKTNSIFSVGNNDLTMTNSIIRHSNDLLNIWGDDGTAIITYSNIEGGYTGTGNIDADPMFCDTLSYKYYATSPVVGAGENGVNMGAGGIGCDVPQAFEWVSSALDTINITKTNLTDTYTAQWTESKDVYNDSINYLVYAKVGVYPAEEIYDTTVTSVSITYQEILWGVFEGSPVNGATVSLNVKATDGIDTVDVTGDNRVIYVNRYESLSTEGEGVPVEFALHANYPNPFNPTTTLRFDLPEVSNLTLTIYNMLGQKVRTFNYQNTSAGYHSVKWNATNDYGDPVGAGVYLYQLQTKDFVKTRKMVLLK